VKFTYLAELRSTKLRWADGANVKREVDIQMIALLGPKTEAELAPPSKKKAQPVKTTPSENEKNSLSEEKNEADVRKAQTFFL
jgi:glutaminyl-tRNA synthetase